MLGNPQDTDFPLEVRSSPQTGHSCLKESAQKGQTPNPQFLKQKAVRSPGKIKLTLSNNVRPGQKLLYKKSRSHGYRPGCTGQPWKHRHSMGTDSKSQTWIYRATPEAQTLHRYRPGHSEQPQNTDTSAFKYKTHIFLKNVGWQTARWLQTHRQDRVPSRKAQSLQGFYRTGLGGCRRND